MFYQIFDQKKFYQKLQIPKNVRINLNNIYFDLENHLDIDEIISFIKRDKKYEKGKLKFVILKKIGYAGVTTDINDRLLRESIKIL